MVNKLAQAVIAEAEPHRRRFPNFACEGRSSRTHTREDLYEAHSRPRPVRGNRDTRRRHGSGHAASYQLSADRGRTREAAIKPNKAYYLTWNICIAAW